MSKISKLKTPGQLKSPTTKWDLSPSSLVVIQLARSLPSDEGLKYVIFLDNIFTNTKLFKALKTIGIGACGTAKSGCGFPVDLPRLRVAATKNKDWGKKALMTVPANKNNKSNIDDGDILCIAWVDLNTVQFMTTVHTIEDLKTSFYKNSRRRHRIPANSRVIVDDEEEKLLFPMPIVEYNQHMGGSDGNAQQRAYYSPQRSNRRYWWSIFIFLLDAAVLNAFKLWRILYPNSTLSHLDFQKEIVNALISNQADALRKRPTDVIVTTNQDVNKDVESTCKWEHLNKKDYCLACKRQVPRLKRRRPLAEIDENCTKRRRASQTRWQCKSCGQCCKKEACWEISHRS